MSQSRPTQHEIDVYSGHVILNGGDQVKAWRLTFPDSKAMPETQHTKASLMHNSEKVQKRIKELQSEQAEKDKEEFDLTAEQVKKMLVTVYKKSIKDKVDQGGNLIAVAPAAAVSALSEINKMNGYNAPKKIDHTSKDGSMTPQQGQTIDASKLSTETLKDLMQARNDAKSDE